MIDKFYTKSQYNFITEFFFILSIKNNKNSQNNVWQLQLFKQFCLKRFNQKEKGLIFILFFNVLSRFLKSALSHYIFQTFCQTLFFSLSL